MTSLFRPVEDQEDELRFRQWARDNYECGTEIKSVWHPVVRDECEQMNKELSES